MLDWHTNGSNARTWCIPDASHTRVLVEHTEKLGGLPTENRQQVDAFYCAALAAGGKDNGAPGLRPEYHATYYAAFVIGPDGHNVEAVCHAPER